MLRSSPALILTGIVFLAADLRADDVRASVEVGVSSGHSEFHLALAKHYEVDRAVVVRVRERGIPDDHVPVALFIAKRARVQPSAVVALRLEGRSWFEISTHFGLSASLFHVHVERDYGPPYGNAFGHFRNRKRSEWRTIRLSDSDLVSLVNVRFLSIRYGRTPDEVVQLHAEKGGIVSLHGRVKARKKLVRDGGGVVHAKTNKTRAKAKTRTEKRVDAKRTARERTSRSKSFEGAKRKSAKSGGRGRGKK